MTTRARPRLTARSVLASTLLGVSPPELPVGVLVATAELLGVRSGAARVALSRMVASGEVEATARGYRLTGRLAVRQARQDLSRRGPPGRWDGTWRTAVVTAEARSAAERGELRAALSALRHAELREGVWLRPDNLPEGVLPAAERTVADQTLIMSSRVEDPVELAAALWALDDWRGVALQLHDELAALRPALDDGDHARLAEAFVTSAATLRHLQADPLLPSDLLDGTWPGPLLRRAHAGFDDAFKRELAVWQRSRAARLGRR